ncbi:DHH family phosphoesterase [Halothermothrix orenii]|uniref:Phosphoesterase RecJ domain protein n=1 Tax=Halothermothrix orenii (strain H 168 / OCM 544 / DSM 9562) TaxID=373903 RepID=B8CW74_HALOH|nr:bifunctional oligoribonuclease/PAP phosphatase NrnA [Halothermothrix orenii]ACL69543.1 phosphoesterase RecJ domain protein [Halothermothrix orenii H 168]
MIKLTTVIEAIKKSDNYLIVGHVDPDGDCIGSMFALKWGLERLQKKALVLLTEPLDKIYDYLNISRDDYLIQDEDDIQGLSWSNPNIISLDTGSKERLGNNKDLVDDYYTINIDHHIDNTLYGDLNYVDKDSAATGEIVYQILEKLGIKVEKKIGTAIITALVGDTGGFSYQNTKPEILRLTSDLMESGVDLYTVNRALFASYSFESLKLKGMVFSKARRTFDGRISYFVLTQEMINKSGASFKDTSGLVNFARDIKGVEVGILFQEKSDNEIKVNFRSNNYCPVNEIAAEFGGGGHPRAAGCTINNTLGNAIKMVLKKVKKYV